MDRLSNPSPQVHPYSSLPREKFWKTAIAEIDPLQIQNIWRPKFPLSKTSRILTAGSCFAQHISKSLKARGFNWIDSEPAPDGLDASGRADGGYGVFSFRTGNIYSTALLKQWLFWSLDLAEPSTEVFVEGGRYYDPFRPTIPSRGYASEEELFSARKATLRAICESINSADVFIFTLGLTESWVNPKGFVYPMCPGTIRGRYLPEFHRFHNFSYDEIVNNLADLFDEIRKINPHVKFLLTVSPVPLTATASAQHVLTATTYSKSVLRATAGRLAEVREDVDYFPSFELITGALFKGRFFERNLRSVTDQGVQFVMRQFLSGVESGDSAVAPAPETARISLPRDERSQNMQDDDVICEEMILESWSRQEASRTAAAAKIVLIGDSQMGMLADALSELKVPFAGGGIMGALAWHKSQFLLSETTLFHPAEEAAWIRWEETYNGTFARFVKTVGERPPATVITNIGMHLNDFWNGFSEGYLQNLFGNAIPGQLPVKHFSNYFYYVRGRHIDLLRKLVETGCRVICVSDPPVQVVPDEAMMGTIALFDDLLLEAVRVGGCEVFNARKWVRSIGGLTADMMGQEGQHASVQYYRQLFVQIAQTFELEI